MKLVIEWYTGGSYLNVECVEYESTEAFYVHLETAVKSFMAANEIRYKETHEYRVKMRPFLTQLHATRKPEAKVKLEIKIKELAKYNPVLKGNIPDQVNLGGIILDLSDFVTSLSFNSKLDPDWKPGFDPPEIKTLDEWFSYKISNNRGIS